MSNTIVSFSPEAKDEVMIAYLWYQSQQPHLGNAFRESLRFKIESIKEHPETLKSGKKESDP